MTILQEYSDTTKELVAIAVDAYKEAIDEAVGGSTVNYNLLVTAVLTLKETLLPLVGQSGFERVLSKLEAEPDEVPVA